MAQRKNPLEVWFLIKYSRSFFSFYIQLGAHVSFDQIRFTNRWSLSDNRELPHWPNLPIVIRRSAFVSVHIIAYRQSTSINKHQHAIITSFSYMSANVNYQDNLEVHISSWQILMANANASTYINSYTRLCISCYQLSYHLVILSASRGSMFTAPPSLSIAHAASALHDFISSYSRDS